MKTEVTMSRELFGMEILQKSKSGFFSATDLIKAGNSWRAINKMQQFDVSAYYKQKSTIEFMKTMEDKIGCIKISARGRGHHTWIHPFLFIDMALAISPTLKLEVYSWIMDSLLKYRNESGNSYKQMCGALFDITTQKSTFVRVITSVCDKIQNACGVEDWNKASEDQLKLRDCIHNNIYVLSDIMKEVDTVVSVSISKAKTQLSIPKVE